MTTDQIFWAILAVGTTNLLALFWRFSALSTDVKLIRQSIEGKGGAIERIEHLEKRFDEEVKIAEQKHKDYELMLLEIRLESLEKSA